MFDWHFMSASPGRWQLLFNSMAFKPVGFRLSSGPGGKMTSYNLEVIDWRLSSAFGER
jgi:hypothetical protein